MPYSPDQRIEIGPWFEAGQKLGPAEVQDFLSRWNQGSSQDPQKYCIYVHIPFCPQRCRYCALYTFEVKHNKHAVLDEYLDNVIKAIKTFPAAFQSQPPTTVHFGGGTPLFLGVKRFSELIKVLRDKFGDSQECEWAVETTTSSINPALLSHLAGLRCSRIHLGVQTLDNKLRSTIQRRESGEKALEKIYLLHDGHFDLSVDLIIGFKQQTEQILQNDLELLYDAGVRMFSICELRLLQPEDPAAPEFSAEADKNYKLWCLLWKFMQDHQLIPIHLGQFARNYVDNLYYTHPARGEACIAIGPYAHGSAGNLLYANKLLPDYYTALQGNLPPFDFGVIFTEIHLEIRQLERELLAHEVSGKTVKRLSAAFSEKFDSLLKGWRDSGLLMDSGKGDSLILSRDGSWLVGNMIFQARRLLADREQPHTK